MLIYIEEKTTDGRGVVYHRPIASWSLPETTEGMEVSFTALATPNNHKVATYRISIVPGNHQSRQ